MATVALTVQDITRSGLTATYTAATAGVDGNVFDNEGGRVFFHIKNGGGGAINATFITPQSADGLAVADRVVNVGAGVERFVGPFPSLYEAFDSDNSIDKAVQVTYDTVTSVTVAAIRLPRS